MDVRGRELFGVMGCVCGVLEGDRLIFVCMSSSSSICEVSEVLPCCICALMKVSVLERVVGCSLLPYLLSAHCVAR